MKPVLQTNFEPGTGDCFRACVASILELPLEDVPNFCSAPGDWWASFQRWLGERGLFAVEVAMNRGVALAAMLPPAMCILTGKSPRGDHDHAIVGRAAYLDGFEFLHDPSPTKCWIEGEVKWATFFALTDPSKGIAHA